MVALIVRALLVLAAIVAWNDQAQAQAGCTGQPSANTVCAGPSSGGTGLPSFRQLIGADLPALPAASIAVNTTAITGGTAGRLPYNNTGTFGEFTMGGDCTLAVPAITCTKTGGAAFAASATTDATNASNVSSGTLASARLPTGMLIASTGLTGGTLNWGGSVAADIATAVQFSGGTANKLLAADKVFTGEVTVTYGATTTFDFNTFINAAVTLTGNITTVTASNMKAGQAGTLRFIQDGTGSRTIPVTLNSNFKCAGGCNYVLSTAANSVDVIPYFCVSPTYCIGGSIIKGLQ